MNQMKKSFAIICYYENIYTHKVLQLFWAVAFSCKQKKNNNKNIRIKFLKGIVDYNIR